MFPCRNDPTPFIFGGIAVTWLVMVLFYLFIIGLALLGTIFWIIELIDVCRREFPDPNTKIIWILVLLFSHGVGALVYYFAGRSQGWLPGQAPLRYSAAFFRG